MEEPSVLDYLKSLVDPRRPRIRVPDPDQVVPEPLQEPSDPGVLPSDEKPIKGHEFWDKVVPPEIGLEAAQSGNEKLYEYEGKSLTNIWRLFTALLMILVAQSILDVTNQGISRGLFFYGLAVLFLVWSYVRDEFIIPDLPVVNIRFENLVVRTKWFFPGIFLMLIVFLMFGGNRFTLVNFLLWWGTIVIFIFAFWSESIPQTLRTTWSQVQKRFREKPFGFDINLWTLAFIGVFFIAGFYRFYRLEQVPPEMFSDHAEKLLDVADVLRGQTSIFFPRNTGREAFQMYLTAAVAKYLGTGLSFTSLKIGTMLAGLLTIPFIYLLGKELGNRRVGLYAMGFAGIAYWPNVISRVALRFALYPLFAAPTLFFLVRGLRRRSMNDFIVAGIFLGLGLHGYSPFRFVPFVILAAFIIYWLHQRKPEYNKTTFWGFVVLVWFSFLVFLPLLRYITESSDNYHIFAYRSLTRLTGAEQALQGSPFNIFMENLGKVLLMPGWDNGNIWVHSVVGRPALDVVSAGLFFAGVIILLIRYIQKRKWEDLFLILSVPLLMLPSALSLAFPGENPSLNRTAGAVIPIFIIVGLVLDGLLTGIFQQGGRYGRGAAVGVFLFLFSWSAYQNYDLVFNQYYEQFRQSAWNTSEIGAVINSFSESYGQAENAFVIPYPYWIDTRLVGIRAGFPLRDFALPKENIIDTQAIPGPKIFIVYPQDQEAIVSLMEIYPNGILETYESSVSPDKNFLMYFVITPE